MKIRKKFQSKSILMSVLIVISVITAILTMFPSHGQNEDVDPSDFILCTYLGGSNRDLVRDGTTDSEGNIIVTGQTLSPDFPVLNAFQNNFSGGGDEIHTVGGDAFVAKFAPNGQLIWSTYLGGSNRDGGRCIGVDASKNIYILGMTNSLDFPVTDDAFQSSYIGGSYDLFITKFAPNGSVIYSSYLGTDDLDDADEFVFDSSGNLIIVGGTASRNLPVTSDAYQSSRNGGSDGFIFRLASNCSSILYCTYFGGIGYDGLGSIDIDSQDNILLTGPTETSSIPLTDNAYQSSIEGPYRDYYIAKFNSTNDLVYSTLLGGSHMDDCFGVSFDSRGNMYATGRTWSPDYPVKNAFQMEYSNESADGIITKFNSKGKLDFSSYAGGSAWDTIHFVDADVNDNMITVGSGGPDGFPIRDAFQEEFGGGYDSVVMMLTTSGIPFFCSYLGGSGADHTWSLSQVSNKFLLTGETTSPDFPASADSFQQSLTGAEEGFIFRFDYASYFGAKGVDTNPNNTPGFSLLITSIGVSLLFIINSKKENR